MRKLITILAVIFTIALLIGGCAQKKDVTPQPPQPPAPDGNGGDMTVTPLDGQDDAEDDDGTDVEDDTDDDGTDAGPADVDLKVSAEDLEKLKSGIEGLDPEDLGGLSE